MQITFIEIQNFRKLKSVRIDFSPNTTLFVGANNSGKTSATLALRCFLSETDRFTTNDFTLSNWPAIEKIAAGWEAAVEAPNAPVPTMAEWEPVLPALDVWIEVSLDEVHHVRRILPSLDWAGGQLGVRLRLEPKDLMELYKDYLVQRKAAKETGESGGTRENGTKLRLWPESMSDYLERRLHQQFAVRTYLLDARACRRPANGFAEPQSLPTDIGPIEGNPLSALIRVDPVPAQRGFRESGSSPTREGAEPAPMEGGLPLSEQLRAYYARHLDPSSAPEPRDLAALVAIEDSQAAFNVRLEEGFRDAISELEELNYPGVADPRLRIATRLRPIDGLKHNAAVQYELGSGDDKQMAATLRLPEDYNGLGYQHLISIVFRLMAFRDSWMRVGKAGKSTGQTPGQPTAIPPLHLVIVEEPEAHLHPQVQQVFVRKAYEVLRNNQTLRDNPGFRTQLIVSTHSSHVAHETNFSCLRYFRRMGACNGEVPFTAVVNLTEVFGDETQEFVARYIRATHCDLFFADGAILVEGDAERILVPHFIREHYQRLHRCYVTLLQVGGSHAHRLRRLIEHLGLTTLIVTDVDPGEPAGHHMFAPPERGAGLVCNNPTLKSWHPGKGLYDELLALDDKAKVKAYPKEQFTVRVAYQNPVNAKLVPASSGIEILPATFEDSLIFENIELCRTLTGGRLIKEVQEVLGNGQEEREKAKAISQCVRSANVKAEFALDLLLMEAGPGKLSVPRYLGEGLEWMQAQLLAHHDSLLRATVPAPKKEKNGAKAVQQPAVRPAAAVV